MEKDQITRRFTVIGLWVTAALWSLSVLVGYMDTNKLSVKDASCALALIALALLSLVFRK